MIAFLREWAPFVLLVVLGWALRSAISAVYKWLSKRIDDKVPDDMPIGGGAWLAEQIDRECLERQIHVFAGPKGTTDIDAYFPSARTIILSREVHEKKDASFWATAGHELGHAIVRLRKPIVGFVLDFARVLQAMCTRVATILIFANVLYVRSEIDELAFGVLFTSLGAYAFVLVDEALASIIGLRMLARDERVNRSAFIGGVTSLAAGFMTYVGGFVGQVMLVLSRDFIVAQIHKHRSVAAAAPMDDVRLGITFALAFILGGLAVRALARELREKFRPVVEDKFDATKSRKSVSTFVRGLLGAIIVAIVWDRALGHWFPLVCVAGLLASSTFLRIGFSIADGLIRALVLVLVAPILVVVVLVVVRIRGVSTKKKEEATEKPPVSQRTAAEFIRLQSELEMNPPWHMRATAYVYPLLQIAFVAALVVSFATT